MLTEKKDTPYIAIFKFQTREEVICKVVEENAYNYIITHPLTLAQTEHGFGFAPIMMMADQEKNITVPKNLVIVAKPMAEIEEQYTSAVSGIILPKSNIV